MESCSLCLAPWAGELHCMPSRSPAFTAGTQKSPLLPLLSRKGSGSWSSCQEDGLVAHYVPPIPKGEVGAEHDITAGLDSPGPEARPDSSTCAAAAGTGAGASPHLRSPSSDATGVSAQNVSGKRIRRQNRKQLLRGSILCVI